MVWLVADTDWWLCLIEMVDVVLIHCLKLRHFRDLEIDCDDLVGVSDKRKKLLQSWG